MNDCKLNNNLILSLIGYGSNLIKVWFFLLYFNGILIWDVILEMYSAVDIYGLILRKTNVNNSLQLWLE